MINQYPVWKQSLILIIVLIGALYALPNLFGEDPVIQISSASRSVKVDANTKSQVETVLKELNITTKSVEILRNSELLIRFNGIEEQLKTKDLLKERLGNNYTIALNLKPATPEWLLSIGALPMYLGLDLRGGVHFLMDVDMEAALQKAQERYTGELRSFLREKKIRYRTITRGDTIAIKFLDKTIRDNAIEPIQDQFQDLTVKTNDDANNFFINVSFSEAKQRDIKKFALDQNITTLRNRVNELGVAEPVIQQQGDRRIVVQLPGVQDPTIAVKIIGATATLEFRGVDGEHDVQSAVAGKVPPNAKLYYERGENGRRGNPILLKRLVIATGNQITDASSGLEQQNGSPAVFIKLDGPAGRSMLKYTGEHIGKPMAVVFIETKIETKVVDDKVVKKKYEIEEVINVATIRDVFSNNFQISGLDSTQEARTLALLLRAGALAAPIEIVEERTVGPSLGQESINQGFLSVVIGLLLVICFMPLYYRMFGLVADIALLVNIILIIAILSMLQATLTLPGIAGIVLTVGMAVDANVLIFERIREEINNGSSPQASIYSGYEKALSTIADANITTFIAAIVLFSFGTGPIKGFAVTLSIGIITSMFTSIMGTRAIINLVYGNRSNVKLAI